MNKVFIIPQDFFQSNLAKQNIQNKTNRMPGAIDGFQSDNYSSDMEERVKFNKKNITTFEWEIAH